MSVLAWAERRSQALSLWDIGFLKVSSMLFGMIVGAYVSAFVIQNVWWFAVPMLLLGGWSGYHWFTAEAPGAGAT
jgi:putative Mn2+ efflux pump MntP